MAATSSYDRTEPCLKSRARPCIEYQLRHHASRVEACCSKNYYDINALMLMLAHNSLIPDGSSAASLRCIPPCDPCQRWKAGPIN